MTLQRIPYYRPSDNELLGYSVHDATGWRATTLFGYLINRTATQADAEKLLKTQGLQFLTGMWQYYDTDDGAWFPCILKEASEHSVTVIRTNALGHQDPDDFKFFTIKNPSEEKLVKSV